MQNPADVHDKTSNRHSSYQQVNRSRGLEYPPILEFLDHFFGQQGKVYKGDEGSQIPVATVNNVRRYVKFPVMEVKVIFPSLDGPK